MEGDSSFVWYSSKAVTHMFVLCDELIFRFCKFDIVKGEPTEQWANRKKELNKYVKEIWADAYKTIFYNMLMELDCFCLTNSTTTLSKIWTLPSSTVRYHMTQACLKIGYSLFLIKHHRPRPFPLLISTLSSFWRYCGNVWVSDKFYEDFSTFVLMVR